MRRLSVLILMLLLLAAASPAFAMKPPKRPPPPAPQAVSTDEPTVGVFAPPSYTAKRIVLFPLEIPSYVLKAALWPIGGTFDWMQRNHYIERVENTLSFKSERIWIYPVMDKSPGSSFGGGPAIKILDLFKPGENLYADYRVHVNLDMFADIDLGKMELVRFGNIPLEIAFNGSWQKQGSFNYYGVGNDSAQSNQSSWSEHDLDGAVRFGLEPLKNLGVYAILGGSATSTGNGSTAGIDPVNSPPPGYGRWLSYLRIGGGLAYDTRDSSWDTRRGGLHSLEFSRFQDMSGGTDFSYNDVRLLLTQHIPLWSPQHTLMLRTSWWVEQSPGTMPVPRMTVLDASHWLRGFSQGRFRDRASAVFNVEYYFPLFSSLRGMILFDYGRVFDGLSNFSFKNFKYSAGGGFDLNATRVIVLRLRAAYGGEGVKFLFTLLRKQSS